MQAHQKSNTGSSNLWALWAGILHFSEIWFPHVQWGWVVTATESELLWGLKWAGVRIFNRKSMAKPAAHCWIPSMGNVGYGLLQLLFYLAILFLKCSNLFWIHMCVGVCMPQGACGGRRTICGNRFLPSTMLVLGSERRLSGLVTDAFTFWSISTTLPCSMLATNPNSLEMLYKPNTAPLRAECRHVVGIVCVFEKQEIHVMKLTEVRLHWGLMDVLKERDVLCQEKSRTEAKISYKRNSRQKALLRNTMALRYWI